VTIGREIFAAQGYHGTSLAAVLERAGLARGGFYHHFAGKRELFGAVAEEVETGVLAWMAAASSFPGGAWNCLRAACGLYVSACSDPGVRRILLQDGPAVLEVVPLEARRLAAFRTRLEHALEDDPDSAELLAPLLLGGLNSAALRQPTDDVGAWSELQHAITFVLEGLRLVQQQGVVPSLPATADWEENPWRAWRRHAAAMLKSSAY